MIRFDTMTDKIVIDTEVWTGSGKIKISRTAAGVSIQHGESVPMESTVRPEAGKGVVAWYKRAIIERLLPQLPL
jgi:hypothetical protein